MTALQFTVIVGGRYAYGPFTDREEAERFAAFVTAEIDPAEVRRLLSPVAGLLAWRDLVLKGDENADPF